MFIVFEHKNQIVHKAVKEVVNMYTDPLSLNFLENDGTKGSVLLDNLRLITDKDLGEGLNEPVNQV